jgi:2-amino-4-hydroxy-6-hydroxymethyldihydropteridine diphosphokinase
MQNHPTTAYIALGANLGDREKSIRHAINELKHTPGIQVTRISKLIENPAIGGPENSPDFLNGVVEIQTTLGSHDLLHRLLEIERHMGRERREKWSPRIIDLDLLLYGDKIIASDELVVPHPLMHERRFVLEPLAGIAPNVVHPTLGVSVTDLLLNLPGETARRHKDTKTQRN